MNVLLDCFVNVLLDNPPLAWLDQKRSMEQKQQDVPTLFVEKKVELSGPHAHETENPKTTLGFKESKQEDDTKFRVTIFPNGSKFGGKLIFVKPSFNITELLRLCSEKLTLKAKRLFLDGGGEIDDPEFICPNDIIYVSQGESFIKPTGKKYSLIIV